MKPKSKSVIIFAIAGILMGYVSFLLKGQNMMAAASAMVVLYLLRFAIAKMLKINEKMNWFMTNGGWIYILIWFIAWVIFYNL